MANNTRNRKTTNKFTLPSVTGKVIEEEKKILPFNGKVVEKDGFSFSFSCFDRSHKLFNLGSNTPSGTVSANWYIDLLDCLKSVSNMNTSEMKVSLHDLHPIDWSKTNTSAPVGSEQREYMQFRINKSKGRVIGFPIDGIFYIVWLDPHHNLTNSEGYGKATYYKTAYSIYEQKEIEIQQLRDEIEYLKNELYAAEILLNEE